MTNIRCGKCSLVNFSTAEACKRCGEPLDSDLGNESYAQPAPFETHSSQGSYDTPAESYGYTNQTYQGDSRPLPNLNKGRGGAATLLALICLVALIGIPWYLKSSGANDLTNLSWRDFNPDGSFSIQMPGEPKRDSMSLPTPAGNVSVTMYHHETAGQTAFAMGVIDYQSSSPNVPVEMMFNKAVESLTNRTGMTVLSRKNITLDGRQGIELEIKPPASAGRDGDKGIMRLYWAPPRIYMVMVGGPDSAEAATARAKYLDSFKILKNR
jgi:hypothetical protein